MGNSNMTFQNIWLYKLDECKINDWEIKALLGNISCVRRSFLLIVVNEFQEITHYSSVIKHNIECNFSSNRFHLNLSTDGHYIQIS